MATVQSISEVIKDSDKEHVPTISSESLPEEKELSNGVIEEKSANHKDLIDEASCKLDVKCANNDNIMENVAIKETKPLWAENDEQKEEPNDLVDIEMTDKEDGGLEGPKESVENCDQQTNENHSNDSKDSLENGRNREECSEESKKIESSNFTAEEKEVPQKIANGTVAEIENNDSDKSKAEKADIVDDDQNKVQKIKNVDCDKIEIDCDNEIKEIKKEVDCDVKMEIDEKETESGSKIVKIESKKEGKRGIDEVVEKIKMEDAKSDALNQESLLQKLGFSAVKQLDLKNLDDNKDENIDVSNYDMTAQNKLVLKAQEKVLGDILEKKSMQSSRSSTPGVIMNGSVNDEDGQGNKKFAEQRNLIDSLREDLRNEEAKLLLLRKVYDSQTSRKNGSLPLHKMKDNSGRHMNMPSLHPKNRIPGHSYQGGSDGNSSIQIAPKVIVGSKNATTGSNLPRIVPSIVSSGATGTTNADGTRAPVHGNVAVTGVISQPVHKYYIQVGNQLVPAAPPTCMNQPVYAMPVYTNATTLSSKPVASVATTAAIPSAKIKTQHVSTAESQASKHSAAKAALRRQLEQTLLQIPPPRPPMADWRVIPNVNSMDFMMLVGLDEIVDMILENDGKPTLKNVLTETLPDNPLICDQCGMDFSPLWKMKDFERVGNFLCEKCSLTNTKKDLKAEHTSRLKSAFLKALKQEQEIEEKIKAGEDVNIGSPPLEKDLQSGVISHHQPMHSVHKSYKHQKGQKNSEHHHQAVHHHHHQVVQHYPHHTSLVHQLHQQHMQQQQVEYEPPGGSSHRNQRWHPYMPSHHHGSGHAHNVQQQQQHHRTYSSSARGSDARHEYYVVHHPQHSTATTRWAH
eukprot:Seg2312.2 transcript_id=Seg2312.2/GoldUCD/mRNA.D3Y31 product="Transcriptional repressor p66-alpha" protein_id=Seg2312.2/GoldUCD/D3Y31